MYISYYNFYAYLIHIFSKMIHIQIHVFTTLIMNSFLRLKLYYLVNAVQIWMLIYGR